MLTKFANIKLEFAMVKDELGKMQDKVEMLEDVLIEFSEEVPTIATRLKEKGITLRSAEEKKRQRVEDQ